jgi:hypothetical protein
MQLVGCKQSCVSLEREFHTDKGTFGTPSVSGVLYRHCVGAVMCLTHFVFFVSRFSSRGRVAGTRNVLTSFCGLQSSARTTCTTHVCHMLFPVSLNFLLTSVLIIRLRMSEGCRRKLFFRCAQSGSWSVS